VHFIVPAAAPGEAHEHPGRIVVHRPDMNTAWLSPAHAAPAKRCSGLSRRSVAAAEAEHVVGRLGGPPGDAHLVAAACNPLLEQSPRGRPAPVVQLDVVEQLDSGRRDVRGGLTDPLDGSSWATPSMARLALLVLTARRAGPFGDADQPG
jgi:hypothetical protein